MRDILWKPGYLPKTSTIFSRPMSHGLHTAGKKKKKKKKSTRIPSPGPLKQELQYLIRTEVALRHFNSARLVRPG